MHDTLRSSPHSIALAFSIAIFVHVFIGLSTLRALPDIQERKTQTIQLTIASAKQAAQVGKIAAVANSNEQVAASNKGKKGSENTSSLQQQIATQAITDRHVETAKEAQKQNASSQGKQQPSIKIPTITTPLPDFRRQLKQADRTQQQHNPLNDMANLFKQQKIDNQVAIISSNPNLPPLSNYEKQLLQKLVQSQYHDRQYPISKLSRAHELQLEIQLHESGAVRNARIIESSKNLQLDKGAIRAALAASPYPEPPTLDRSNGFRYLIHIRYEPDNHKP